MKQHLKLLLLAASVVLATNARAQDAKSEDSDKLDIKQLEKKYWAAKDDDFSVVQNRSFTKEGRYHVSLLMGVPINDPNSTGNLSGATFGYHFNERHGVELQYLSASFRDNDATAQFVADHKTIPNHNKLKGSTTLIYNFIPLYAKMSFLDRSIIYFDMGVSIGIGTTTYEQMVNTGNLTESGTHYMISFYQHFFLNEKVAIKLDFRNMYTNEKRMRYALGGDPESMRPLAEKSVNDTALLLGVTYFFGGGEK